MHPQNSFGKPAFAPRDHLKPGRPARNDDERASRLAEIDRRYKEPLKDCSAHRRIAIMRRHDLEILCRASDVPEDGGLIWLDIAANHIAFICRRPDTQTAAILKWRARFTPMVEVGKATKLAARVIVNPHMPTADEVAHRLGLTMERRTELGITSIGATDCDKAERGRLRRKRAAARERARRAKAGAAPHATSARRAKPWTALGISRAAYYRNRQKETSETNSCAAHAKHAVVDAKQSHGDASARGARSAGPEYVASRHCGTRLAMVPTTAAADRFRIDVPVELRAMMLALRRGITAASNRNIGTCFPRTVVATTPALGART